MVLDVLSGLLSGVSWTTVFISIGGSLLVSISSEWLQFRLKRNERKKLDLENWYHKTISTSQRLRNQSLKIPYGKDINEEDFRTGNDETNEKIVILENRVSDLIDLHAEAPPEVDEEVLNSIRELEFWIDHPREVSGLSTTDLRDKCKDCSESIIDKAVKESDRYDEVPY